MRQAKIIPAAAGVFAVALAWSGVATGAQHGADGKNDDGCRVVHQSDDGDSGDGSTAESSAGSLNSHITMGNGKGSASTSVGGGASGSSGVSSSTTTGGGGGTTTTTTRNGKSVTVHSSGNGSSSSAAASSSDGGSMAAGSSDGDCVIIEGN